MFEEREEVMMGYIKLVLFTVATLSPPGTDLALSHACTTRSLSATIETEEV